jgi:hypothetical protein
MAATPVSTTAFPTTAALVNLDERPALRQSAGEREGDSAPMESA